METYIARSYEEIYKFVSVIKQKYFKNAEIWFRGQGSNQYLLKPSLFRTRAGIDREKEIFNEYKMLTSRMNFKSNSEWETLINMQHYGIPTRLLDWTNNLGVALYFAATSSTQDVPMCLYIMNPIELNKLSSKKGIPTLPSDTMGLSYIENYVNKVPFPARYPIAVKCEYVNDRVWMQSGIFTIHGDEENQKDIDIIETILDKQSAIYKIDIAPEAYDSLLNYFDISGIKNYTIFPDMQGIVGYLNNKIY